MGQGVTQAVVVSQASVSPNQFAERIALFGEDGSPIEVAPVESMTGADVTLTGLTSGDPDPIDATDTVNEAMAKLQAQIDALAP